MFPWLHLNATPKGDVYPCCSNDYTDPVGNTKDNSLEEIFNSPKMKELRLDMLNERKNKICDFFLAACKMSSYFLFKAE